MSDDEYVILAANYKIFFSREFQCDACLSKKTTPESLERIRKDKGCFGLDRVLYNIAGKNFKSCPGNFQEPWAVTWFKLYRSFQKGIMPFAGTLTEQPAKALEIFDAFEFFEFERAQEAEDARLKAGRGSGV